jgi:hypothetical protein
VLIFNKSSKPPTVVTQTIGDDFAESGEAAVLKDLIFGHFLYKQLNCRSYANSS